MSSKKERLLKQKRRLTRDSEPKEGEERKRARQDRACECDGFTCIPTSDGAYVLLKRDTEDETALLVFNLGVGVTLDDVKKAFGARDATVTEGGGVGEARLVFDDAASAIASLGTQRVKLARSDTLQGWAKYVAEVQRRPDPEALRREVDEFMERFDARMEAQAAAAAVQEVDKDGFVLVTRKRRATAKDKAGGLGVKVSGKKKKAKTVTVDPNFYRWASQQQKLEQLATLRSRFAADKERLAALKQERKFRP